MGLLAAGRESTALRRAAYATLGLLVLMLGAGFRDRPTDVEPSLDWVVLGQLALAGAGMVLGPLLLRRSVRHGMGPGLILLACYGGLLALTSLPSPWARTAIGYTILWLGGLMLCAGLVYSSETRRDLEGIQQVLLWSLAAAVFLTTYGAWTTANAYDPASSISSEPRLGLTGATHPSNLAYYAGFAFCLSYWADGRLHAAVAWGLRIAFVAVILLTGTRVPLLICGGAMLYGLVHGSSDRGGQWLALFLLGVCALAAAGLVIAMRLPGSDVLTDIITRGEPSDIHTLTSRTDIWRTAIDELEAQPYRAAFGFGYGASRFAFLQYAPLFPFAVHHTHNDLLEGVYAAGALTIPLYLAITAYLLAWPLSNRRLSAVLGDATVVRGVAVTGGFLLTSLFGPFLSAKLAPPLIVMMVFLLILDLKGHVRTSAWRWT